MSGEGAGAAERAWKQTLTGRAIDVLSPDPEAVDLFEIAVSLARIVRFDGHVVSDVTNRGYSVAQHCCVGALALAEEGQWEAALGFLLHDAHEYALGDQTSPVTAALDLACGGDGRVTAAWNALKARHDAAIYSALGLAYPPSSAVAAAVRAMDIRCLKAERDWHGAPPPRPWGPAIEAAAPLQPRADRLLGSTADPLGHSLAPAEAAFLWLSFLKDCADACRAGAAARDAAEALDWFPVPGAGRSRRWRAVQAWAALFREALDATPPPEGAR